MRRFKKAKAFAAGVLLSCALSSATAFAADYTVMQDDSLYKIGVLFNTSSSMLKSGNHLTSDMIYPGQVIDVPAETYSVKGGDTLFLIAKRYGIPLTSLRKANNKWDDLLMPGQVLILPGIKPSGSTQGSTNTYDTVIPYTSEEVNLLARLITAETTDEPYEAMVAVGAVVVNRVKNPDWPSTISSVINQVAGGYYQFTPVKNGYINNPPSDASLRAAWAALYGSDPSNGAMFYFDDSSTNQWLWSKTVAAEIGSMVFVY
jgi:N-acetylmuramoyl-L-alanine amidase